MQINPKLQVATTDNNELTEVCNNLKKSYISISKYSILVVTDLSIVDALLKLKEVLNANG